MLFNLTLQGADMKNQLFLSTLVALTLITSACSSMNQNQKQMVGTGAGAVVGGVAGHALFGNTVGTVAGAAGGALVGNQLSR